jgi:homoserine/homoserine lactone efflux protein
MDITLYLTFLLVSFGLIIIPGPNVLVIVSTSITHGTKHGLQTVAGTSLAMAIQLLIVAIGTAWFVQQFSNGIYYLKWIGVTYLLYLGLFHLKASLYIKKKEVKISTSKTFANGFLVSLTNPKTFLFFSAFLPQFVTTSGNFGLQILLLSLSFLIMAIIIDSGYALLSSKMTLLARKRYLSSYQNGFSGLLYLGASIWLAATNRSS